MSHNKYCELPTESLLMFLNTDTRIAHSKLGCPYFLELWFIIYIDPKGLRKKLFPFFRPLFSGKIQDGRYRTPTFV